jgi:exodeoxyribonuclease V gamma subunit
MTLHLHRSQRAEALAEALARAMSDTWPDDPFEAVPIVVGSRGMERWLRHELATHLSAIAQVDFLFPRSAFEAAARTLLDGAPWLDVERHDDPWSAARLALRVLGAMRARLEEPAFAAVRRYLGDGGDVSPADGAVRARELSFAEEVAGTIERLLHDRPDDARAWADDPSVAPAEHAWLAALLRALEDEIDVPSPARRLAALQARPSAQLPRALFVFGLSTLRPGDKLRLAELARHLELHVLALAPSSEWWEDIRARSDQHRALRDAEGADAVAAALAELDRNNALLAADGAPSRDLQLWFEAIGYDEPADSGSPQEPASTQGETLLGALQAWIDQAGDNPRAPIWSEHAACRSIEVHACHGPLRQCEALRDELLRRFAADATLEPRHVLVMTPDVATYAPLLAAVFARHGGDTPAIPLHVADLGLRATNPVAEALLQIVALADERVSATRLLDVLGLAPVRAKLSLDDDDLADLRAMIVEAGIRWAWDADDRARHDQPAIDQNTVRFGLERLALGALMRDPGDLAVVPAAPGGPAWLAGAVPLELATRERIDRFGRLAEACARLQAVRPRLLAPATPGEWRTRLSAVLDDFTEAREGAAWLRAQVDDALAELLPDSVAGALEGRAGASTRLPLDRSAVLARLRGAFELPQHGDRPVTGAATVCALEPMRSVPFRVIAMVGLDDGAFPRAGRMPAWDPFARPRRGEYDRRTVDRHLFLEAILCARDALLIFGTGFEPKRGARAPLSVVVSELSEVLGAGLGRDPDALPIAHPLQPWSTRAFEDAARLPFDPLWATSAAVLRAPPAVAGLGATRLAARWPEEEVPPRVLTADALAAALCAPQKELLRTRLGLALSADDVTVEDREPLEHGALDQWQLRDRVLRARLASASAADAADAADRGLVDALEARLRGEGVLAASAGGRRALEEADDDAQKALKRAADIAGTEEDAMQWACEIDGLLVTATAADARRDQAGLNLVWLTASKTPNARLQMRGWVAALVAAAAGEKLGGAHLVGYGAKIELAPPGDAAAARARLEALVAIWRQLRTSPIPLFPALSPDVARAADGGDEEPEAPPARVRGAQLAWEGGLGRVGDREDAWVSALFGHLSIDELAERADEIVALAEEVWSPLLRARVTKRAAKKAAAEGGAS